MPSTRLCVFGCDTIGVTVHNFPNPSKFPERFKVWVNLVGEPLHGLSDDVIYKRKKVCDIHFTEQDRNRNSRLNALAVPRLHLPKPPIPEQIDENLTALQPEVPSSSGIPVFKPVTAVLPEQSQELHSAEKKSYEILEDPVPSTSKTVFKFGIPVFKPVTAVLPEQSQELHSAKKKSYEILEDPVPSTSKTVLKFDSKQKSKTGLKYFQQTRMEIRTLKREVCRLRKRGQKFKERLFHARNISKTTMLEKLTRKMSLPTKIFTMMQYRESGKKPKGHRFNINEKILALSLYKKSPKGYGLLSKCFVLPSAKSLKNLLSKIVVHEGINKTIFEKIKFNIKDNCVADKLCVLMFDEMYISPQVNYSVKDDSLKGFDSFGHMDIADHVLTFMIRGIIRKYKQPVAYYFTQRLNKIDLKAAIKEVIAEIIKTGLIIVATVCDQSAVNVGAIESLVEETRIKYIKEKKIWRHDMFVVNKKTIIPIYDVPHLIKGIRNNLLSKNAKFIDFNDGNKEKIVKWEFFQKLYDADKSYGELNMAPKLTEEHVNKEKINKMRVKIATQLLSRSVAVAAKHLVLKGDLEQECLHIVPFVLFFDKLFDSLNCSGFNVDNGKVYRAGVKPNSPHHKLWQDAKIFLKNFKFLDVKHIGAKVRILEKTVPSVKNFIRTIEGFQVIWRLLNKNYNVDTMFCRNINQDPLENFFGGIRSAGARNVSPNSIGFESAYKSLLLNNFTSAHSLKANCEEDMDVFLQSYDFLLQGNNNNETEISDSTEIILNENMLSGTDALKETDGEGQRNYVCGWVLKKCLQHVCKSCKTCKKELIGQETNIKHSFIAAKEYETNSKWLVYPSDKVMRIFFEVQNVIENVLKNDVPKNNLKQNIFFFIDVFSNIEFNCKKHKDALKSMFIDKTVNVLLYSWCRCVNRILTGKKTYDGDDTIKLYAQVYYNKHKKHKIKK